MRPQTLRQDIRKEIRRLTVNSVEKLEDRKTDGSGREAEIVDWLNVKDK